MSGLPGNVDAYLDRIGLEPSSIRSTEPDVDLLETLLAAHVRRVPFENLSIVGDPFVDEPGEGVTLDRRALYEKIVERRCGGYCFELSGIFTDLLVSLGFEASRAASVVLDGDGEATVPANHHAIVVSTDGQRYVADPGLGRPQMVRPVPMTGEATEPDVLGVQWRVLESGRRDARLAMQSRRPDTDWETRYVFDPTAKPLTYFEATCDYLSTAPESPFTQRVTVRRRTEGGRLELKRDRFVRVSDGERSEREVNEREFYDILDREFELTV